jgi:hypothetical protein
MPFKKIKSGKNKGKYKSPSGKIWTAKQVKAYYATDGFKRKVRSKRSSRKRSRRKRR